MNRKLRSILSLAIIFFGIQVTYMPLVIVNEQLRHPPIAPGSGDSGWYAGSIANQYTSSQATHLQVSIRTPTSNPNSIDQIYVLLSCFDNANSYNQVGFSSMGAIDQRWGMTTSYTHDNDGNHEIDRDEFYYDPQEVVLATGTWYTFTMFLSNGYLTYEMWVNGWKDFSKTVYTGGDYFRLEPVSDIWDFSIVGFTLYEEVYKTEHGCPDFDFKFQYTYADGIEFDNWDEWYAGSPPGVDVTISCLNHYVFIDNPVLGGGGGDLPF